MMNIVLLAPTEFPTGTYPIAETWKGKPNTANTMSGKYPWNAFLGTNAWGVENEALKLENSGTLAQGGRLELACPTNNYMVSADITEFNFTESGLLVGSVCVRMHSESPVMFYALDLLAGPSSYSLLLFKFVDGVQTTLDNSVTFSSLPTSGRLGLSISGSSLTGYWNGATVITGITDTAIPTGLYAGIQGLANGTGNRVRMDNFTVNAVPSGRARRRFYGISPLAGVR